MPPKAPTLVAGSAGFVADQNLTVDYLRVTSSTQQFRDLRDGNYDLVLTAPDNAVNYRLNNNNALQARRTGGRGRHRP